MAISRKIEELERQFAENPRRYAAPFADALRKSDEVPRALEVIRLGLELNPDYIPGSVILGRCHLDLGDDIAAEAAFSRVLDLDNENVIALKSLADIMERQGRTDEAIRFLAYLLDVDRSNDEAREQLNRIQASLGGGAKAPAPPAAPAEAPPQPAAAASPAAEPEPLAEPTALWEPPANAPQVDRPSWYEPTSASQEEPPEFEARIVEEPSVPADLTPVSGLEPTEFSAPADAPAYSEFFLEREEEIILTSHSGAEYQVANDSESLMRPGEEPAPPVEIPAAEEAPAAEAAVQTPEPEIVERAAEAPVAEAPPPPADEAPFEWAMHVGEETGFHPGAPTHGGAHPPDSFDAAIEGIAPVEEDAGASPEAEDAPEAEEAGPPLEPVLVVTESMAELYAAQGHRSEALGVYRILYDRNPANERLRQRIIDLEAALAAQVAADAAPSYAASVTGGRAVAAFLGGLLKSRPAPVTLPEAPAAAVPEVVQEAPEERGEEAVASGEPTRPAEDRLSLGAVFGEDASPVPPASAAAAARSGGAGGFSFDDFFGKADSAPSGRSTTGSQRAVRGADEGDDLDQFHSWLQGLKR